MGNNNCNIYIELLLLHKEQTPKVFLLPTLMSREIDANSRFDDLVVIERQKEENKIMV